MTNMATEQEPLLQDSNVENNQNGNHGAKSNHTKTKAFLGSTLVFIFILALVLFFSLFKDRLPSDPMNAALLILERAPIIVSFKYFNTEATWSICMDTYSCPGWAYWYIYYVE
jgi:hypothetical protein